MYIFRKIIVGSFLLMSATGLNLHAEHGGNFGRSNDIYSGNRFDGGMDDRSNQMYNDNRFSDSFYRGVESGYNESVPPVYGYYGYTPELPNSQIFPDDAEANALYWGEVQQMESN